MRNLWIALMFIVAAVLLTGCPPTAIEKATTTLDKITIAARDTQVAYRKTVGEQLNRIVTEERNARTAALAKAGCPLDPTVKQPTPECEAIVANAQAKYDARKGKLVGVATKLDAATNVVYAALLTAVDVLILVRDGAKDQWPQLAALIEEAVKVAKTLADAWADFQANAKSY